MDRLHIHTVHLHDGPLALRPMTEADWDVLYRWNNDPEVLYFSEGNDITAWPLVNMQLSETASACCRPCHSRREAKHTRSTTSSLIEPHMSSSAHARTLCKLRLTF